VCVSRFGAGTKLRPPPCCILAAALEAIRLFVGRVRVEGGVGFARSNARMRAFCFSLNAKPTSQQPARDRESDRRARAPTYDDWARRAPLKNFVLFFLLFPFVCINHPPRVVVTLQ
jgi:hypothetical protein